ncbi:MAG: nucleic acid-binding protein [Treponema sp.]|jgi:hypothetical protein|nr:nucleic acid-binding protein [Treponema sp.]
METNEIFDRLKSLQVILGRKYELESKIEEAPKQLSSQDELLSRMKKEFIEKNKTYDEIKEKVSVLKADLDEAIKTREEGEKAMDNITTHREYETLDKQIADATEKESVLRKELQKEEKSLAELNETMKATETMISSQEADLNASKEALEGQLSTYRAELEQLKSQEAETVPGLDQEILFKFQRIIQRNSEGIVAVRNGVCSGCHMILPAQFANEVREGDSILFCPYCSRILYYEEVEDGAQESYFNDAGSLADLDEDFADDEYDEDDEDLYDESESADEMSEDRDDEDLEESDDSDN